MNKISPHRRRVNLEDLKDHRGTFSMKHGIQHFLKCLPLDSGTQPLARFEEHNTKYQRLSSKLGLLIDFYQYNDIVNELRQYSEEWRIRPERIVSHILK
jgi:hypothetical protein